MSVLVLSSLQRPRGCSLSSNLFEMPHFLGSRMNDAVTGNTSTRVYLFRVSRVFLSAFVTSTELLYKVVFKKLLKYILFVLFVVGRMGVLHTRGEVRGQLWHRFPPPIMWVPGSEVRFSGATAGALTCCPIFLVQTMSFLTGTSLLQMRAYLRLISPGGWHIHAYNL